MDYISKEKLRHAMYHEAFETDTELQKWESGCWIRYRLFTDVLDALPSADVVERNTLQHTQCVESVKNALDVPERNVGKWIDTTEQIGFPNWGCSCCGSSGRGDYKFCPWCGARMEE